MTLVASFTLPVFAVILYFILLTESDGVMVAHQSLNSSIPFSSRQTFSRIKKVILPDGQKIISGPVVVNARAGITDVFFRNQDYDLMHMELDPGQTVLRITSLGLKTAYGISAISPFSGAIDLVAGTGSSFCTYRSYRDGKWSEKWITIKFSIATSMVLASRTPSSLDLYYVYPLDNSLRLMTHENGEWSSPKVIAQSVLCPPAAVSLSPGTVELYACTKFRYMSKKTLPADMNKDWNTMPSADNTWLPDGSCAVKVPGGSLLFIAIGPGLVQQYFFQNDGNVERIIGGGPGWSQHTPGCSSNGDHIDILYNDMGTLYYVKLTY